MTIYSKRTFGLSSLSLAVSLALTGSMASTGVFAEETEAAKAESIEKIARTQKRNFLPFALSFVLCQEKTSKWREARDRCASGNAMSHTVIYKQ